MTRPTDDTDSESESSPSIPNLDVTFSRPSIRQLLRELATPPAQESGNDAKLPWVGLGGGVAVCASGPESLLCEAQNAVAQLGVMKGMDLGGIGLHTEFFAM